MKEKEIVCFWILPVGCCKTTKMTKGVDAVIPAVPPVKQFEKAFTGVEDSNLVDS
jgi:hypothetical protein